MIGRTANGLAYERTGTSAGSPPVVLVHAGVADRRMWDEVVAGLAPDHDVVRYDLRGFGESTVPWGGPGSPAEDARSVLDELGVERAHLVGASFGAGVATELALLHPDRVASLLLVAPGGSLIAEATPELREFWAAEEAALEMGDLTAAAEANARWWVDGPRRPPGSVGANVRQRVVDMQRQAFELTQHWDDDEDIELDPGPLERLTEIAVPVLVLSGGLDIDAILDAADRVMDGVRDGRAVRWDDTAHVPSMERPDDFVALARGWFLDVGARG